MKTIFRILILFIIFLINDSCSSNRKIADSGTQIVPLSDTVSMSQGSLVYGLPRTVFTVMVAMERTIEKPGPYARYAGDLLGLENVIQSENEYWSIELITVKSHQELDPSEFYVIKSSNIFMTNILELKKEGLILDLNPEIFDNNSGQYESKENYMDQVSQYDLGSDEYFFLQRDTAYRRVNIDSTFIRVPYIVEKKRKFTVDQLAERAARNLMDMREGKHMILTGEANVFPQSDAAIKEINRIEKEYTELFTGKTIRDIKKFTYQIIPEFDMAGKPVTLFRFSEVSGPVSGSAANGVPVTATFIPEEKTKGLSVVNSGQTGPVVQKYDKLYYRIPDVVNLRISQGNDILYNSRKLVYQFGEVIQLPSNYILAK